MKNQYPKILKIVTLSFVLFMFVSVLELHITVSANKDAPKVEAANAPSNSDSNLEPQIQRVKQIIESSAFPEFDVWVGQYEDAKFRANDEQIKRGETLAAKRRELFKELIQLDPQAALKRAISVETYKRLPATVAANSEKRISAYGDFLVYVFDEIDHTTGKMMGSHTEREVVFGDDRYKAVVYGRRETMPTKLHIPLQGIIIGDVMAVDESPARIVEPTKYAALAIDASKLSEYGAAAEIGGEVKYFSAQSELNDFVNEQIEWESKIGPTRPQEKLAPNETTSTWTEGAKKVLYIRVDFPDKPGEPIDSITGLPLTIQRAQDEMNKVNTVYTNSSYGKTSFQLVTVTPVIRLPQPSSFYIESPTVIKFNEIMTDARNAARTAGFETNNYDLDVVASINNGVAPGGLGLLGGKGAWLIGFFAYGYPTHEIGHNYGLNHSGVWRTTDGTVIGHGSETGGDLFDAMGYNGYGLSATHFMATDKRHLDWLTEANTGNVTTDGVYRVFAQDFPNPNTIRLLRIKKDSTRNYDIEFRQTITSNPNTMNGAIIRWHYPQTRSAQLLDMTPNTNSLADAPLLVGQSFLDYEDRIRITVLGKGNTNPESLDIKVELNVAPCTYTGFVHPVQTFPSSGGEGTIAVNTQVGCPALLSSSDSWVSSASAETNSGTTTRRYAVAANYNSQPRTGTFSFAGQLFTIQQVAGPATCLYQPKGLVAWWRGEGNALDQTGVNNGSIQTGMSYSTGKVGGGFRGAGTPNRNRIYVPDSPALALDRSMSIEGWVRLDAPGIYAVIVRGDDRQYNGSYAIEVINGNFLFSVNSAPNGSGIFVGNPSPVPANQFVHFAGTLDDATGQMRFYINGSLVNQTVTTIRPYRDLDPTMNPRIAIGNLAHSNLSRDSFNGIIDELSVYNRALSTTEIQAIYNAGTAATGAIGKCLATQSPRVRFDFDGDGKSDVSVFRPDNGVWYLQQSTNGFTGAQFGVSTDKIVPADYDGDGKTDVAVYRSGTWYLNRSSAGFTGVAFGDGNDIPQPADFDGDGKAELAVFRPSNGTWYILNLATNQFTAYQFGASTDKPVASDYDGDGKADYAVYRPSNGTWYLQRSTAGFTGQQFGDSNDKPVAADYDGDGKTDLAVFRPSNGTWYLLQSTAGFTGVQFGISTDLPTPADYDGDGKADVAVFRSGTWYLNRSTAGFTGVAFGATTDKPIPNAFVP